MPRAALTSNVAQACVDIDKYIAAFESQGKPVPTIRVRFNTLFALEAYGYLWRYTHCGYRFEALGPVGGRS